MLEPTVEEKILGNVEIREVYKFDKRPLQVVLYSTVKWPNRLRLVRDGIVIFTGNWAV